MAETESNDPVLRNAGHQQADRLGTRAVEQTQKWEKKVLPAKQAGEGQSKKGPAGGFDETAIPHVPPGYTLKITFHRADNLPFADYASLSSDPYIVATLKTSLEKRHKQDPDLRLRIPTVHKNTDPVWNVEWVVANVPASGFFLKCRLYDEDPADHDDRLGNVHVDVPSISDNWQGFKEQKFPLKKRMGSKRAYTFRGCAALFSRNIKMSGDAIISIENLGRTPGEEGGRAYTVGPLPWSRHYSPLIGRLTGVKDTETTDKDGKATEKYNFQSIQMQLSGPVPADLYHRYVEFKPFVAGMFTDHSLRGRILNRALHHQHARIYNYDRATKYGKYSEPCEEMTRQFLDFVHHDQGGRIFTYVLSLDGLWRFTETGKEFGIDLLSKHTMHSDVSIYIAFSGEFFIRHIKHPKQNTSSSPDPATETHPPAPDPDAVEQNDASGERPISPSKDPSHYELIIDNDSGTYRPNAKLLPVLRDYMAANLPGLKVTTLDCQEDEEKMNKLKSEQRERKKQAGQQITYMQNSSSSGLSSSDEEELNERAEGGAMHENKFKGAMHKYVGGGKDDFHGTWNDTAVQTNGETSKAAAKEGGAMADGEVAKEQKATEGETTNEKQEMVNGTANTQQPVAQGS